MRLIDADKLIERMGFYNTPQEREKNAGQIITLEDFDNMPTAYDVDKIMEQLEEVKKGATELCLAINDSAQRLKYIEKEQTIALAIEIVKAGVVND